MKHHFFTIVLAFLVVLASSGGSRYAHAQDDAQARFKAALAHFHAGEHAQAIAVLRDIAGSSPNVRLYLARSLRELGEIGEAYEQMQQTVREAAAKAQTEERYVETRDAAATELAALEPRVGKVLVVVTPEASGVSVTLNGQAMPADRIGVPVAVMPGSVAVVASAPGKTTENRELFVAAGKTVSVTLSLSDDASQPPTGSPLPPTEDDDAADDEGGAGFGGPVRIAGIAVAVVGIGGMVMFGVSKSLADKKFDSVNEACGATRCTDPAFADDIDKGKRYDALTNAGLVIGIVGLAGGALMIIFGGDSDDGTQQALGIGASPGGGLGMSFVETF